MLYLVRLFLLLINIDQEIVLNWFKLEDPNSRDISQTIENSYDLDLSNLEPVSNLSLNTVQLIIQGLWEKIQDGLTLADIENVLFFILFVRFIILAIRYNLKTSLYITCIGLLAGFLWYRHLIDLIAMYRNVLLKLPFLNKLGLDAIQLRSMNRQLTLTDLKLVEDISWSNPGQVLYYGFTKGIINVDSKSGFKYYIDPISMILANLKNSTVSTIIPLYYKVYNKLIPKIYDVISKYSAQLSGIMMYAIITRLGKRYCPYLIRWHWTFLLIIGLVEQIFINFIQRVYYFQSFVLIPETKEYAKGYINSVDSNLILQINTLNLVLTCVVLFHIGFILFGLFHAIWGQYFYIPFFVENTELHIGLRPKNSIYSGGATSWQDGKEKEKKRNRLFPKLWYGWFGNSNQNSWQIKIRFKTILKKVRKLIKKQFKK